MSRQQRLCARPCHALLAGKVVLPLLLPASLAAAYPAFAAPAADLPSPSRDRQMGARGPASPGDLGACANPFGKEIDGMQGKVGAGRSVAVHRQAAGESPGNCQALFIAASSGLTLGSMLLRLATEVQQ